MIQFFDTSVLVAAYYGAHAKHQQAVQALGRVNPDTGFCAAHTLAESYTVLTGLPVRPAISAEQGRLMIANLLEHLTPVALTVRDHTVTINRLAAAGLRGGILYDALIMACARKAGADVVFTFNHRDFVRVAPDFADRIREP